MTEEQIRWLAACDILKKIEQYYSQGTAEKWAINLILEKAVHWKCGG